VSELFDWTASLEQPFSRAPGLYSVLTLATIGGVALEFSPLSPVKMLSSARCSMGLSPRPSSFSMMLVSSSERAMGHHVSPTWLALGGWVATTIMGSGPCP